MKRYFYIIVFFILYLQFPTQAEEYKIGFSQCTARDLWRQTQIRLMEIELSSLPEMQLIIKDAKDNTETQIKQIEDFLDEGIDLLIVSPNESEPIAPVVERVFKSGIPVIVIDRKVETDFYTSFIGTDNYVIGIEAGNYAVKLLKGEGRVLEIRGLDGSSPAKERHDGFLSVLNKYPKIKIVESVSGDWKKEKTNAVVREVVEKELEFDLAFAHNDIMGKEVYNVLQQMRGKCDKYILGVDGLPGNEGGIQMVLDNILDATFLYQTGGGLAIQTANNILNGQRVSKQNIIPTIAIDEINAPMLKSQANQIELLHNKIEKQKLLLTLEVSRNDTQKLILFFLISVIVFAAALTLMIHISFTDKKRANLILTEKNNEIELQNKTLKEQQDQLIKISNELEEATQAKLTFFTNISHEFKTPLTLIKGPLENLLTNENLDSGQKKMYSIMHRNTVRLLQMVNQIMDFRKLENKKLTISATENKIIAFVQEIFDSFKTLAESRNIDFNFNSDIDECNIWFDCEKIEKVLFNVLSNAFNFTPEGGKISITLSQKNVETPGLFSKEICIAVSDSGVGIPEENINKIFNRFFHSGESKIVKGTGIGLSFSKELVELHRGRIIVKSVEGEGTRLTVFLPVGNLHLVEGEMQNQDSCWEHTMKFHVQPESKSEKNYENEGVFTDHASTILIVEDMSDMMDFVRMSLGNGFRIITAKDGKEGFQKVLDEEPDLVISDVMMPEMDGLELTKKIKSELETSHIPVILLTAKTSLEDKIKGIEGGADAFIEKPFNSSWLKTQVIGLLQSREHLRDFYKANLDFARHESELNQADKKFLEKIRKRILQNIGKEEDMNVDELSHMLGISRVHLYRKVKKLTDMSVSEFVISIKLKKSLEYLRGSGKTITEIAYESGFSSQSYYTRCFKEQFKILPSEYIKKHRKEYNSYV